MSRLAVEIYIRVGEGAGNSEQPGQGVPNNWATANGVYGANGKPLEHGLRLLKRLARAEGYEIEYRKIDL